jgi:hypothetical protein
MSMTHRSEGNSKTRRLLCKHILFLVGPIGHGICDGGTSLASPVRLFAAIAVPIVA